MESYLTSDEILEKLFNFEGEKGLNGAILLVHPGVSQERIDKLYKRLDEIILKLKRKGYSFERFY